MPISKDNTDKLDKLYRFNMVNDENEEFKRLGLKELYFTAYPSYINLKGNVFYTGPLNSGPIHYQCILSKDIEKILRVLNSNIYERFEHVYGFLNDDYPIRFSIYNNQIFFSDTMTLSVYKKMSALEKKLIKSLI